MCCAGADRRASDDMDARSHRALPQVVRVRAALRCTRSGGSVLMTTVDEIAEGIYRLSTWVPDVAPPAGFTFNQFLVDADEPLLFHTGPRTMFPLVSQAVARILPVERLRWITFGHIESDECGSMNEWLAAAPTSEIAHGMVGCMVSIND